MLSLIFPLILILASVALASVILGRQLKLVRQETGATNTELNLNDVLQVSLDNFYLLFSLFFKHLGHNLWFYALLVMRKLVIWSKIILTMLEKRFSRLIDSVSGKGTIKKRGSVSLFLAAISEKK